MQTLDLAGHDRTHLLGAQRHDRVHLRDGDVHQAFGAMVRNVDLLLSEGLNGERIDFAWI